MYKKCKFCRERFKANSRSHKFCSPACQRGKTNPKHNRVCAVCGKTFWHYREKHVYKFCSDKCRNRAEGVYDRIVDRNGFYLKNKHIYFKDLKDYDNSPTGKVYTGVAKEPLMENKSGHGYQGVLLQDETRQFVQCSNCGEWFKKISVKHLEKCSNGEIESVNDYKERFGLLKTTGLVSDETSLRLTENALKNKVSIGRRAGTRRGRNGGLMQKGKYSTREYENKFGTCPKQLKARLKEFILQNRELPNSHNKGGALAKALWKKFGGVAKAMKHYKLPTMERYGTTYLWKFPNGNVYKYNINKFNDREEVFQKMIEQCDFFN